MSKSKLKAFKFLFQYNQFPLFDCHLLLSETIISRAISRVGVVSRLCGGDDSLIKVGTDVRARALGILGVNFCPGIRFWEVNFARALGFWQFLTKKCNI